MIHRITQGPLRAIRPAACALLAIAALGAGDPPSAPAAKPKPAPPPQKREDIVLHCTPQKDLPREKLVFLGQEWNCELCLDDASRATGMGARAEFPAGTAMIFVYPRPALLSFWMKDCLVDIDMVFVDESGRISAMHEAKKQILRSKDQTLEGYEGGLERYGSNRRAKYCIELPSGTIARTKPTLGQKIDIDWKKLDARAK